MVVSEYYARCLDEMRTKKGLKKLTEMSRKGYTMEQISGRYGLCRSTLFEWMKKYPEIREALIEGKKVADEAVEQALYDSCFDHKVNEIYVEKDADGVVVKSTVKTKIIPANITAQQYWLANRKGDVWKAKQQLELVGNNNPIQINLVDDLKPFNKSETEQSETKSTDP